MTPSQSSSVRTREAADGQEHPRHSSMSHVARVIESRTRLSNLECLSAFLVFVAWLGLFAGGVTVDTEPARTVISPTAVAKLKVPPATAQSAPGVTAPTPSAAATSTSARTLAAAWTVVLLCFLPINLVWLCAASSVLGAFGNRANLTNDRAGRRLRDNSNPYLAAVLRGFFAYLFLISGLLLLDDSPFSNPAPGQYVRLAGFLSLLCFVVSYQPRLFNTLIVWAFHRIEVREGQDEDGSKTITDTHSVKKVVELTSTHSAQALHHDPQSPEA
jgi:hypothetical protein